MMPTLSAEIGIENWLRSGQQETWMNMEYMLYSILRIDRATYCIHMYVYCTCLYIAPSQEFFILDFQPKIPDVTDVH